MRERRSPLSTSTFPIWQSTGTQWLEIWGTLRFRNYRIGLSQGVASEHTRKTMFGQTDPKPADHRGLSALRRCFADIPQRNVTVHPASPGPSWHLQGRADCL